MELYLLGWLSFIITAFQVRLLFRKSPLFRKLPFSVPNMPENLDISIIVPCRNEESNIGDFLKAATNLSPAPREIIVVDDQSSDSTAIIAHSFPGVKVVSTSSLPPTWVGKNWACAAGAKAAQGRYLLFTDADTRLESESLGSALEYLVSKNLNFVSAVPQILCKNDWEYIQGAFWMIILAISHHPYWKFHFCIGQFLLFETQSYQEMGGHTAVKESAAEDLAILSKGMKLNYRYGVCSPGLYKVRMYNTGFLAFLNGWTRILRLGLKRSSIAPLTITFLFIMHLGLPIYSGIVILMGLTPSLPYVAIMSSFMISTLVILWGAKRILGKSHWLNWFYPLALILFLLIMMKVVFEKTMQKPLYWRSREIPS